MTSEAIFWVTRRIIIPHAEFQWSYARSSGPGGQNVNKVNSKVIFRWAIAKSASLPADVWGRFQGRYASRITSGGELVIDSEKYRDQPRNVRDCLEKLRAMLLAVAEPPKARKASRPTAGSNRRRLEEKAIRSQAKQRRRPVRSDD